MVLSQFKKFDNRVAISHFYHKRTVLLALHGCHCKRTLCADAIGYVRIKEMANANKFYCVGERASAVLKFDSSVHSMTAKDNRGEVDNYLNSLAASKYEHKPDGASNSA